MASWSIVELKKSTAKSKLYAIIDHNSRFVTWGPFLKALTTDLDFLDYFISVFQQIPFHSYFFEMNWVTEDLDNEVEFSFVKTERLSDVAKSSKFRDQLDLAPAGTKFTSFLNLSGDGTLVVPLPRSKKINYSNMARFVETADQETLREFWLFAVQVIRANLRPSQIWISTHGLGVSWLHLRIDSTPKYYHTKRYV